MQKGVSSITDYKTQTTGQDLQDNRQKRLQEQQSSRSSSQLGAPQGGRRICAISKGWRPCRRPPPQGWNWRLETERSWIEYVCSNCVFSVTFLLICDAVDPEASLGSLVGLWAHLRDLWPTI